MIRFGRDELVEAVADGVTCSHCGETFTDTGGVLLPASGPPAPLHHECLTRMLVGGLYHQLGLCRCCGGHEEADPPSLSKREAARVAAIYHGRHNREGSRAD